MASCFGKAAFGACLVLFGASVMAQTYPSRPVRLVVPFAPGGGIDAIARTIGQRLGDALGQPVLIDNRPGAGGLIGFESILKAPADGHTLVMGTISTLAVIPATQSKPSYDPLRDFAAVTQIASVPYVIASHPSLPVRSLGDLVALAKTRPGQISYGTTGYATGTHLTAEYFSRIASVKLTHVPYKGDGPGLTDLMGGHIQLGFFTTIITPQHVRSGRLRALAVTSATRARELPNVPTVAESGFPGFESSSWQGITVRAGTPAPIVRRLNEEIVRILNQPEVRASLEKLGNTVVASTSEQFEKFIAAEIVKWKRVIEDARIQID
jgi:tripartite-type tricarboxylate transporter receptor subunit TctC